MGNLLPYVILGIASGSVYGLAGMGLVLTYKSSGVFNFANGAISTVAAYCFYFLWIQHGIPWPLTAIVAVGVLGVVIGLVFERLGTVLRRVSLATNIAATIGVVLIVEGAFTILYPVGSVTFPQFLPTESFEVGGAVIIAYQLIIVGISIASSIGLFIFFRTARLGKEMRAVVDNPTLLDLSGRNPGAVRRWAWIIGCFFATLSGCLIVPSVNLDAEVLTLLVIQAFAAAAVGNFRNLPATWIGGVGIGVVSSVATKYLTGTGQGIVAAIPASVPFVVLFVVMLVLPARAAASARVGEHLMERARASWSAPGRIQGTGVILVVLVLAFVPAFAGFRITGWTTTLAYVLIFLSLGFLVRTSGQVSLCHAGFAAIGAVAFSKFAVDAGVPWLFALLLSGLIVAPIGALLAIPAIRLSGLHLALATLGFGIALQDIFYNSDWMFGNGGAGVPMPLPHLSWLRTDTSTGFYYVVFAIAIVAAVVVVVLSRSRMGRLLAGLSDSPVALAAQGTGVRVLRVSVFCISAYIAGIGGAILGMTTPPATGASFDSLTSLTFLALIVIVVGRAPWYALLAAIGLGVIPTYLTQANITEYLQIFFGANAVMVAIWPPILPATIKRALEAVGGRRRAKQPMMLPATGEPSVPVEYARGIGIQIDHLSVNFGGVVAVNDLSLSVQPGRITGLIGPNGAGKTTTLNACSGLVVVKRGSIQFDGVDIIRMGAAERARRGMGRTFQQIRLFDSLTVLENVALGREAAIAGSRPLKQIVTTRSEARDIAAKAAISLELCGLLPVANSQAGTLSTGQRRLAELARCLAGEFKVLLLDEPSSGLDQSETYAFATILREVVRTRGVGILLVEHDMDLVMNNCDYIYVLDFGTLVFEGTADEVRSSSIVQAAYLGVTDEELSTEKAP